MAAVTEGQTRYTKDGRGACVTGEKAGTLRHVKFYRVVEGKLEDFGDGWWDDVAIAHLWPEL